MKTAYELAMERLNKSSPAVKLNARQKKELAELDAKHAAKVAGREIVLKGEMDQASARGDLEALGRLEEQWAKERKALIAELEKKKESIRQRGH